jgi:two-component system, LytTR family, response regulator
MEVRTCVLHLLIPKINSLKNVNKHQIMQFYKTIIIEDNPDNADVLRKIIKDNHPELSIVAEAQTVNMAKEMLLMHKPDIALMDIELTPGTSFDVLAEVQQINPIDFEIIFITAHQRYDYVTKAIDFSSLAFLSKPIDPEILRGAIEKAKAKQTKKIQIEQLLNKLQALEERNKQIIVPTVGNNKVSVTIGNVTYFEADGHTTIIHYSNQPNTTTAFYLLGHFKKVLKDEDNFFQVHHSLFVNVDHVKSYKHINHEITLRNGDKLKASRRFGKDFKNFWDEYNDRNGGFWDDIKNVFR